MNELLCISLDKGYGSAEIDEVSKAVAVETHIESDIFHAIAAASHAKAVIVHVETAKARAKTVTIHATTVADSMHHLEPATKSVETVEGFCFVED